MKGRLVVNHFLNKSKYNELHAHLLETAKKQNINLVIETNLELATKKADTDFVLFWDKDINLAKRLEKENIPVFNSSKSIENCDDKAKTYLELLKTVKQPKTIIGPKIYFKEDLSEFVDEAIKILGLPLVYKDCFGSFGFGVFLCNSKEEILSHISEKPFLLQEFIKESSGHDVRIEVVGGKVVAGVKRVNENDFRSNVTNGGTMIPYTPTKEEEETAIKACNHLGLNFGGVDILSGNILCEVNSNAHIINIMNCTKIDIAPLIFDEIRSKL